MAAPAPAASPFDLYKQSDCLGWEGFPQILWDLLREAGYTTPPTYRAWEYLDRGVIRCRVHLQGPMHPEHPERPAVDLMFYGHRFADAWELAALRGIFTFVELFPQVVENTLFGLFPPSDEGNARWLFRYLTAPQSVGRMPTEASFHFTRWLNAFNRLQSLLCSSLEGALKFGGSVFARTVDLEVQLETQTVVATSRANEVAELRRQLAEMQVTLDARTAQVDQLEGRVDELEAEVDSLTLQLGQANDMLDMADEQFHQLEQQDPEEVDGESGLESEDDFSDIYLPGSPTPSITSASDHDDL